MIGDRWSDVKAGNSAGCKTFFIDYFFIRAKLNRIYLNTLESNIPARKLYEKLGFTIEGKQISAIMRYNKTVDLVCYYKLNNNPN